MCACVSMPSGFDAHGRNDHQRPCDIAPVFLRIQSLCHFPHLKVVGLLNRAHLCVLFLSLGPPLGQMLLFGDSVVWAMFCHRSRADLPRRASSWTFGIDFLVGVPFRGLGVHWGAMYVYATPSVVPSAVWAKNEVGRDRARQGETASETGRDS